jgi:hypothetical protein
MRIFPDTREVLPIIGECQALQGIHWHRHHTDTSACLVLPDTDNGVLAFLGTGDKGTVGIDVETADGG